MTVRRLRGGVNALLLFSIIVSNTIYQSEWGLDGSIWNAVSVVLCMVFFVVNLSRPTWRPVKYFLPVGFVALSTFMHAATLSESGLNSAVATAIAFMLFWLSPVTLSYTLLRRLVYLYLIVCAVLSLRMLVLYPELLRDGNSNFNLNANSAAHFFYMCGAMALLVTSGRARLLFVGLFGILLLSTAARTATIAFVLTTAAYWLLRDPRRRLTLRRTLHSLRPGLLGGRVNMTVVTIRVLQLVPLALVAWLVVITLAPDFVGALSARMGRTFGPDGFVNNRSAIWATAVARSLESTSRMLVGYGPATAFDTVGFNPHNSFLEATVSYGYPFTAAAVMTVLLWMWSLTRRGHWRIAAIGIGVLLCAVTETFLFSGVAMLWFFLIFCGIYLESRDSSVPARRKAIVPPVREMRTAPGPLATGAGAR